MLLVQKITLGTGYEELTSICVGSCICLLANDPSACIDTSGMKPTDKIIPNSTVP
uniref:Uncharacterized protein n=1 Tax=Parascaris equorum TaxID=6256 RepID=A0A914R971_PAREQ